jgi:beta-lactam-binding protein with PASTA domain
MICPACGRESDGSSDFCVCGEYLDWRAQQATLVRERQAGDPGASSAATSAEHESPPEAPHQPPSEGDSLDTRLRGGPAAPVLLAVRRLQDDRDAIPLPVEVSVPAGGRSMLVATVRNQSGIVDNFDLSLEGVPDAWWTITPKTVYLVPFGRGAGYEQEVEIALHPPRSPQALAQPWPLLVVATSRAHQVAVATAHATLVIEPYWEVDAAVAPAQAAGRLGARYQALVRNRANAPVEVALSLSDDEQVMRFERGERIVTGAAVRGALLPGAGRFAKRMRLGQTLRTAMPHEHLDPTGGGGGGGLGAKLLAPEKSAARQAIRKRERDARRHAGERAQGAMAAPESDPELTGAGQRFTLQAGETQALRFIARPDKQVLFRGQLRRFTLAASATGEELAPVQRQAVLRQRPWLPWWLLLLVPLIVLGIVLYLLLRPTDVTVPRVVGDSSAFAAEQQLQARGLTLAPSPQTRVDTHVKPGAVIGQTPPAGRRVRKGSAISILVATGTGKVKVPGVAGDTIARADSILTEDGFSLGAVSPKPEPQGIIASQLPAAGTVAARGTPVQLFLKTPAKPKAHHAGAKAGASAAAAAGGAKKSAGGGGGLTVPKGTGQRLSAYEKLLGKDGLRARPALQIDAAKRETVIATTPASGAKVKPGTTVGVIASAGAPDLAYDGGTTLRAVNGLSGAAIARFAPASAGGTEPAFSPNGTRLAFVLGGSILEVPVSGSATSAPRTLAASTAAYSYSQPQFAPEPGGTLIAFVRAGGGIGGALCFARTSGGRPGCVSAAGWSLGPLTWAPDGAEVLIAARSTSDPATFGLLRFTTSQPFSASASSWSTSDALVTPHSSGRGVIAGAISPNGKQLAVLSNLKGPVYRLLLAEAADLKLKKAKPLPMFGCRLAWRSDGAELAVAQGDQSCSTALGPIFGVNPAKPRALTMLVLEGENPAFQPLSLTP